MRSGGDPDRLTSLNLAGLEYGMVKTSADRARGARKREFIVGHSLRIYCRRVKQRGSNDWGIVSCNYKEPGAKPESFYDRWIRYY
jgi:hypothetical protein